jgi:hypothetical protein
MFLIVVLVLVVSFMTVSAVNAADKTLKIAIVAPSASNDLAFTTPSKKSAK